MDIIKRLFGKKPIPENLGRNQPCWCGSGKKYKHCHYDRDQKKLSTIRAGKCSPSG
ncbi:MAG: SEC-C domain-containing protein [Firmicutes bacterium]|nr:SEC-C domain-containing protein [Bacillota bacterium]